MICDLLKLKEKKMAKILKGLRAFRDGYNQSKLDKKLEDIDFKIMDAENELQKEKVNHVLHLLLLLPTAGFWIIVWIYLAFSSSSKKKELKKKLKDMYKLREKNRGL